VTTEQSFRNSVGTSLDWVSISKGIGIILVVAGHFSAYPRPSPAYWNDVKQVIYAFHMPLFFMLSGYLYTHAKYTYGHLIRSKIERLGYPFVSIAAIFLAIKLLASHFIELEQPVTFATTLALLTRPSESYVPLLWYVHALFIMFLVFPLMRSVASNVVILVVLIGANSVFETQQIPIVGNALSYFPYFIAGVIVKEDARVSNLIAGGHQRSMWLALALFAILCLVSLQFGTDRGTPYISRFTLGLLGTLFVVNLAKRLSSGAPARLKRSLIAIGYYSMTIYLFHTIFESGVRAAFLQIFNSVPIPFEMIALLAISSGVLFPLLLEKHCLRLNAITRKFLLGLG